MPYVGPFFTTRQSATIFFSTFLFTHSTNFKSPNRLQVYDMFSKCVTFGGIQTRVILGHSWYMYIYMDLLLGIEIRLVCFSWRYEATEGSRVNFVMREANKLNSILIFILYQNCTVLATKYPFFDTKHPVIILRASLFVVTPSHVAS